MSTTRKHEAMTVTPPEAVHLDELLDQALADSFPSSDPVAIDFASPADVATGGEREKCPAAPAASARGS